MEIEAKTVIVKKHQYCDVCGKFIKVSKWKDVCGGCGRTLCYDCMKHDDPDEHPDVVAPVCDDCWPTFSKMHDQCESVKKDAKDKIAVIRGSAIQKMIEENGSKKASPIISISKQD